MPLTEEQQREQFMTMMREMMGSGGMEEFRSSLREEIMAEVRSQGGTDRLAAITGGQERGVRGKKGAGAARLVRALAAGKGDPERAASFARRQWGDEDVAKALDSGVDAAGGFIVPPNYSDEIIDLLYPATVVRGSGADIVPMDNGNMTWPRLTGGVGAAYVGENQNIVTDQPSFGDLNLSWKKLAVNVPISNDLIRFSNPKADEVVRNDMVRRMALREDIAFLRDDGTGQKPLGMRFQPGVTVVTATDIAAMARVDAIEAVRRNLDALELALENANVPVTNAAYIITPRIKHFLWRMTDTNGQRVFPEIKDGVLNGYPYRTTTQLPQNLGAGANETEIAFANFPDVIIGESSQLIIDVSTEAAYFDGTNVQSAWSRDQTVMRAIARHDLGLRYPQAVAWLSAVRWGA